HHTARALAQDGGGRSPWRTSRARPARAPGGTRRRRPEMKTAVKHGLAAALLLAPLAARAQSSAPVPAPAPLAIAPAAPAPSDDDTFAWVGELFGADAGGAFDLAGDGPAEGPLADGMGFGNERGPGAGRGRQWEDGDDDGPRHDHRMMMRRGMAMRF